MSSDEAHLAPLIRKLESIAPVSDDERRTIIALPIMVRELKADADIVRDHDRPSQCCAGDARGCDLLLRSLEGQQPAVRLYYKNVRNAEQTSEREVTFTFDEKENRELPQIVGQLPVLPKHWWEGTGPDGKRRDVTQTTLETPLGSGPYRLQSFEPGRTAIYRRVPE